MSDEHRLAELRHIIDKLLQTQQYWEEFLDTSKMTAGLAELAERLQLLAEDS